MRSLRPNTDCRQSINSNSAYSYYMDNEQLGDVKDDELREIYDGIDQDGNSIKQRAHHIPLDSSEMRRLEPTFDEEPTRPKQN